MALQSYQLCINTAHVSYGSIGAYRKYMTAKYSLCKDDMEDNHNNRSENNDNRNDTCLKALCLNQTACAQHGEACGKSVYRTAAGNDIGKSAERLHQSQCTNHGNQTSVSNQPADEKTDDGSCHKTYQNGNYHTCEGGFHAKGENCLCSKNTCDSHGGTNADIDTAQDNYIGKSGCQKSVQTHLSEQVNNVCSL